MPQALTLDDLDKLATPAPAVRAAGVPAPAGKVYSLDDLDALAAPAPAAKAAAKIDDPDAHGFWHSFYDEGIAPVADMVVDTIKRGDLGAHAADTILRSFSDQLKTFAGHPDIRNLPIIGTGATATAARMQRQYDKGNYAGMIGSALGFVGQFAAPEAASAAFDNLPAAGKTAAQAVDATGRFGEAARAGLKAGIKAAAPDLASGAAKAAAAAIAEHFVPGGGMITKAAEYAGLAKGGLQAARGLKSGVQAAAEAYGDVRAAQAADAAKAARIANPRVAIWQAPMDALEAQRAADAARPPTEPLWQDARATAADRAAEPAAPPATAAPLTLDDLDSYAAPAAAEAALAPEAAAAPEPVAESQPVAAPQLTDAQRLEDAIDRHAAYHQMQADDLMWANRARRADRYAGWLIRNDLEATPENLARATKELVETKAPSDETAAMIQDRVDWHNARTAAAAPAEAAPSLEDQLAASIEAVKSRRGQQPAAEARHVEGEVSVSGSGTGNEMDTGRTGGRPAAPASPATGAGTSGEQTAVDVPGEQRTYPAKYSIRELADVQPSHLGATFQPNPKYEFANDRFYDDPRNQRKIIDWSTRQGFNPRNLLNTAPTAEIGPPVVDAAGNVFGGNGRTMILQRVYDGNPEGAAAYRAELDRTAHHYGIDPASYAHMKQPVLVREIHPDVLADEAAARRAITDFNKTGTAALTPAERAVADAHGVTQRTLDDIAARMDRLGPDATLAQAIEGRQGLDVLGNLMKDGVISPQEGAALATESKLTRAGKERVSGLMLGRFFTDAKQMDALSDSMRNKLERMAAPLARAESAAGYSLQPTIKSALELLEDAEAHGAATLDDYIRQQGLFSDREYSPEAIAFAKALKSTNPVELTHAARRYAERAKYAEEYQGPGMFGDIPAPLPPRAAFNDSFEHLAK